MKKILAIETSPRGNDSVSRKLTAELLNQLRSKYPGSEVLTRDLDASPLPHLKADHIQAFFTPAENRTPALKQAVAPSDAAVDELLGSDIVVIGSPVWNFSTPSSLKSWVDHIVRAGRTFSYSPEGYKGLVGNKEVYVLISSGGVFSEGPMKAWDFVEPYFKAVFGFLGISNVKFIRAEGLNDPRYQANAYDKAMKALKEAV
jgi:FMN-dependent NADH-azoreductase